MSITWDDVVAIAPEMSTVGSDTQTAILEQVNDEDVHDDTWPSAAKADRARRYLAAHLAALSRPGVGSRGPVTSESAGPVSRSYGVSGVADMSSLESTGYGREYRRLVRNSFGGPAVP